MIKIFRSQKVKEVFIQNASLTLAVVGIALGVFLAFKYQLRLPRLISPGASILTLQEMEEELEAEREELRENIASVNQQISSLEEETKGRQDGLRGLVEEVEELKFKSGVEKIAGRGVVIVLDDAKERKFSPNAIAHASDMRDLVDYLWQSGARAISIKGAGDREERVGPSTSIDCVVNTVLINESKIVPPFEVRAIGDRTRLMSAINDRLALKQIYDRVESEGLRFYVRDDIKEFEIPQFTGNLSTRYVQIK